MTIPVYLDNAATSFPKPKNVTNAVHDCLFRCGNPGRSGHELSLYSMKAVYNCREAICSFFNFNHPENIVFTHNTTYALFLAINGLLPDEGEILTTNLEHNSVIRPVTSVTQNNTKLSMKTFDALCDCKNTVINFENALSEKTKMCVITMCSNVTGKILPYKKISEICKRKGITLIFDAAQLAGLYPIDLSTLYFSAICFAGHKSLYGIMGTGFCIFSENTDPKTVITGGNGQESLSPFQNTSLPERMESGTAGVPGIIALNEGLNHIKRVGLNYIGEKCSYLENRLSSSLSEMENITLYGKTPSKVATVLFNVNSLYSEKTASLLAENGICVRAGIHCAPLCHKALGTLETGAVRVSISHLNTGQDIDIFLKRIKEIAL